MREANNPLSQNLKITEFALLLKCHSEGSEAAYDFGLKSDEDWAQ